MEISVPSTRVSRADFKYLRRALRETLHKETFRSTRPQQEVRPDRGRDTMSRDHRLFHRRAAQEAATQIVTVSVEVVATVDTQGNLIAQETIVPQAQSEPAAVALPSISSIGAPLASPVASALQLVPPVGQAVGDAVASVLAVPSQPVAAQAVSLPQVPAVPTVPAVSLPIVPSVPPFPSDLRVPSVPAFPFSSGAVVVQAVATAAAATSSQPSSPSAASVVGVVSVAGVANPSPIASSGLSSNLRVSSGTASIPPATLPVSSSTLSEHLPLSASQLPDHLSRIASEMGGAYTTASTATFDVAATTYYGNGGTESSGGGGGSGGGATRPTPGAITGAQDDGPTTPLETPQVVGSVVGSLAGAALILAIILLLLRRHKRKRGGALQLTDNDHNHNERSIRQTPARTSMIPSAFLNRFSGMSRSTVETNLSGGERSFQRVSGRKLPSAFSEGMTSDQFSRGGTMSESSFYQDDHGIYGGPGLSKEFGKEIGDSSMNRESGQVNFKPSPARTPMIRNPDDPFSDDYRSHLSPPQSPNLMFPPRGTLGRSLPSADGSRSSRFTENV